MFGYRSRRRSSAGRTRGRSVPTRRSTRKPSFLTKTTPSKKTKPTRSFSDYLKSLKAPAKSRTAKSGLAKLGKAVAKTTPSKKTKPTRSLGVVKLGPATKTPSKRTKPINERPTRSMRTLRGQSKRMENLYKRGLIDLKPRRSNKNLLTKKK